MPLVTSTEMFKKAYDGGYAIGAFNVNNMEIVQGITEACQEEHAPVILQVSKGARAYANHTYLVKLVEAAVACCPDIPIVLHLDHGPDFETCKSCVDGGFTSVMMDGSLMPDGKTVSTYEYNVETTRCIVETAHCIGVSVEGELGCIGSLETLTSEKEDGQGAEGTLTREQLLTDPDQAVDFVRETQLDALAIAIGTSHGAYKFTREPTGEILSIDRVKEIHARLPNTHLVMHGSSSVPQEFLAEIRKFGGEMRETYGVPVKEIQTAIKHGVRKVNVDTDIRLAMTAAIRRFIFENPSEFDPRAFMKAARKAEKEMCKSRYLAFGCEGQGAKIHPIPLDAFARGYSDGTITQKTL